MNIIDKTEPYFNYKELVNSVFKNREEFKDSTIEIVDCEPSKRVYLEVDGEEYWIRYNIDRCGKKFWSCEWTLYTRNQDDSVSIVVIEGQTRNIKYIIK